MGLSNSVCVSWLVGGCWKLGGRKGWVRFKYVSFSMLFAWCLCVCSFFVDQLNLSWTYSLDRVVPGGLWKLSKWPGLKCYRQSKYKQRLGWERAGSYLRLFVAWVCVVVYMYLSKMTASLIVCICPSLSSQIGVTAALLTTIVGVISVNQTWGQEWDVVPISLQVSRLKHRKALK